MNEAHLDFRQVEVTVEIPPHLNGPYESLKNTYKIDDAGAFLALIDFAVSLIEEGVLRGRSDFSTELQMVFASQEEIRHRLRVICAASEKAVLIAHATLGCAQRRSLVGAMRGGSDEQHR